MNPWLWRIPLLVVVVYAAQALLKWVTPEYGFLIALVLGITFVPTAVEAWRRKDRKDRT